MSDLPTEIWRGAEARGEAGKRGDEGGVWWGDFSTIAMPPPMPVEKVK